MSVYGRFPRAFRPMCQPRLAQNPGLPGIRMVGRLVGRMRVYFKHVGLESAVGAVLWNIDLRGPQAPRSPPKRNTFFGGDIIKGTSQKVCAAALVDVIQK